MVNKTMFRKALRSSQCKTATKDTLWNGLGGAYKAVLSIGWQSIPSIPVTTNSPQNVCTLDRSPWTNSQWTRWLARAWSILSILQFRFTRFESTEPVRRHPRATNHDEWSGNWRWSFKRAKRRFHLASNESCDTFKDDSSTEVLQWGVTALGILRGGVHIEGATHVIDLERVGGCHCPQQLRAVCGSMGGCCKSRTSFLPKSVHGLSGTARNSIQEEAPSRTL